MRRVILTILLALSLGTLSAWAQRYDRGFEKRSSICFVSKGSWMVGGSAKYSVHKNDHYHFLVLDDINSDGYHIEASPVVCYAIRDNMSIGMRFAYKRGLLSLDSANLSFQDTNINFKNYHNLSTSYWAAFVWRTYIPLGASRRISIFTEVQAGGGVGRGKIVDGHNAGDIEGTFEKNYSLSLGLNPGAVAFINDHLAVEVNVGMLGLQYNHSSQIHNQLVHGDRSTATINFKVNLFSIGFGLAYYFNDNKK